MKLNNVSLSGLNWVKKLLVIKLTFLRKFYFGSSKIKEEEEEEENNVYIIFKPYITDIHGIISFGVFFFLHTL